MKEKLEENADEAPLPAEIEALKLELKKIELELLALDEALLFELFRLLL